MPFPMKSLPKCASLMICLLAGVARRYDLGEKVGEDVACTKYFSAEALGRIADRARADSWWRWLHECDESGAFLSGRPRAAHL